MHTSSQRLASYCTSRHKEAPLSESGLSVSDYHSQDASVRPTDTGPCSGTDSATAITLHCDCSGSVSRSKGRAWPGPASLSVKCQHKTRLRLGGYRIVREMTSAAPLVVGGHVELHGLVKSPELNGVTGTLVLFNEADGRWQVRIKNAGRQQTVCVRPVNLKQAFADSKGAAGDAQRTISAVSSSLESGCCICTEPFTSEATLHKFGCGHLVHSACWRAHSSAHAADFISSRGSSGQSGARCPLCNAWDGPSVGRGEQPWYERAPSQLVQMCLGYVYQSRWQAAGEDRSADDEVAFISDRIRLAKAAEQYESSMAGMADALTQVRKLLGARRQQLFQADLGPHLKALVACLIPFVIVQRTAGTPAQSADDHAYVPHLMSWMHTLM
jgi:hypothetical protein